MPKIKRLTSGPPLGRPSRLLVMTATPNEAVKPKFNPKRDKIHDEIFGYFKRLSGSWPTETDISNIRGKEPVDSVCVGEGRRRNVKNTANR